MNRSPSVTTMFYGGGTPPENIAYNFSGEAIPKLPLANSTHHRGPNWVISAPNLRNTIPNHALFYGGYHPPQNKGFLKVLLRKILKFHEFSSKLSSRDFSRIFLDNSTMLNSNFQTKQSIYKEKSRFQDRPKVDLWGVPPPIRTRGDYREERWLARALGE